MTIVIDEFGMFGNENIVEVLRLGRSKNAKVVLATQDLSTIQSELIAQDILSNCRLKISMGSDFPKTMAEIGGTKLRLEATIQHDEGEATGLGSAKIQDTFKANPIRSGPYMPAKPLLFAVTKWPR